MPHLIVENGPLKGHKAEVGPEKRVVLGRDPRAHIHVDDGLCSRKHFLAEFHEGRYRLRDLGSSNGTFVNDERVSEIRLNTGDSIRAGDVHLTFLDDAALGGRGLVGKEIGGYRLIERIGRGGMGTVYKALQVSLNRVVAFKILSARYSENQEFVSKFQREAQAAGRLNHPNVVQVYDVGSDRNIHYYSMEFIENGSVQDLLNKSGPLDQELALGILLDAARGLEYAEKRALVHRDIKPDNLMINADGVVKIADLGLAHDARDLEGDGKQHSADEGIFGTPHFIAPEQARGGPVDTRSDMYSLGATAWLLLTGETPFKGGNVAEIISKQINEAPPSLRESARDCSAALAQVVERLMRKDPDARFATASELVTALERLEEHGRTRVPLLVMAGVLVLAGIVAGFTMLGGKDGPTPSPAPRTDSRPAKVDDKAERERQARLEKARREAEASEAFNSALLAALKVKGDARTLDALRGLEKTYADLLANYGDTATADNVREQLQKIRGEIKTLEADALATAQARARADQAARAAVDAALAAARKAAAGDHFAGALDLLTRARSSQALTDRPETAELDALREKLRQQAAERAGVITAEAEALDQKGDTRGARTLLKKHAKLYVSGAPGLQPDERVAALAAGFVQRASSLEKQRVARRAADLEHDQRNAFPVRKSALIMMRSGVDPAAARKLLEAALGRVRTPEWRAMLAADLADLAAIQRLLAAVVKALEQKKNTKIKLPASSDPQRGVSWTVVAVDATGIAARRIRNRPAKRILFKSLDARSFKHWLCDEHLDLEGELLTDMLHFLLYCGLSDEAAALLERLPREDPARAALATRATREVAALTLLRDVRTYESKLGSDPSLNLRLKRAIERLRNTFRDTLTFICNSNGSTWLVEPPARDL